MLHDDVDDLPLATIMAKWPETMRLFVGWRLHCIGCPISGFHRLANSAREHGYPVEVLHHAVVEVIAGRPMPAAPPRLHRRSAAADAGP